MIELVVQDEHQHGFGRVVYKFCDAFHAYFYVFIPETGEYGWRATTQYNEGLRSKWGDTFRRAWFVLCTGRAVIQTTGYVVTYSLLSAYDLIETVCLGWVGVATVLVAANYYVGNGQGVVLYGDIEIGWWPALGSCVVALTGVTSRVCRWLAYTRPSPLAKIGDLCEQLKETMEDRAQIERLAQAFWKEDGGVGPVPRDAVEALRAARAARNAARESRANHRELWKEVHAVGETDEEPRRGRRSTVGEDVPSGNGPYRSTRVNYRPRSDATGNQMFETPPCEAARIRQ
ncbi:hypothetical protein PF010_g18568 [Phytophthora fragariae]|uniref:Uncharacterized protein n=1 Tax=Phytophthora fragariae TaxID=53985 RepID=A0A6A3ZK89_9STRA|nr:hypothetical protein PF003_g24007 [Phytophthora fragariae]KAE8939358.1 hypothetical protein PF009_g10798 [Phytophthora fragariae]KAE8985040.1 hypothetical protein PF011_g20542 [Phytophthora fragariae]KAE9090473.1 hypothetical protein PF010_g18568 [Phytophthora fragariae]KAE9116778.1 hypothetical protein PF007_g9538 [Phytophthora fragariae]